MHVALKQTHFAKFAHILHTLHFLWISKFFSIFSLLTHILFDFFFFAHCTAHTFLQPAACGTALNSRRKTENENFGEFSTSARAFRPNKCKITVKKYGECRSAQPASRHTTQTHTQPQENNNGKNENSTRQCNDDYAESWQQSGHKQLNVERKDNDNVERRTNNAQRLCVQQQFTTNPHNTKNQNGDCNANTTTLLTLVKGSAPNHPQRTSPRTALTVAVAASRQHTVIFFCKNNACACARTGAASTRARRGMVHPTAQYTHTLKLSQSISLHSRTA